MDNASMEAAVYAWCRFLVWVVWGLYSLWVVSEILRMTSSVWKKNWFWFSMKAGYYIGVGLGLLWAFTAILISSLFPQMGMIVMLIIQALVAFAATRGQDTSEAETIVWYALPFIALPFWFAYRQGQKEGTFPGPNPPFNSGPTAGSR